MKMKFGNPAFLLSSCAGVAIAAANKGQEQNDVGSLRERSPHRPQPIVPPKVWNYRGRQLQEGPPPIDPEIFVLAISIRPLDKSLAQYEVPLILRFTNYFGANWWNCIAAYSTDYMDTLTKNYPVFRVPDVTLHTKANRVACMAQSISTYTALSLPEAQQDFLDVIWGNNSLGINYTGIVEAAIDPVLESCGSDVICLQDLAALHSYSPTIMGQIVAKLTYDFSIDDGYNQLGKDYGCVVNCRSYKDTTGYYPTNDPNIVQGTNFEERWEPLLEDNGKGFFYRQEHITPHIGSRAKFRYLSEADRDLRVASDPGYSNKRLSESLQVIELMSNLDDTAKVEVEVFDDKLIVADAIFNSFIGKLIGSGFNDLEFPTTDPTHFVSLERFVNFVSGILASELDAVIIAWKEKVNHDLVRPTSIIKKLGVNITTWTPEGQKEFPSSNFESYKRVMPHSEYPSGSACLFQTLEDYIVSYMNGMGLDPTFPVLFMPFPAGSSKVETGVPAQTITLAYPSIEAMATAGGQSRLKSGVHFEASVPAAKELCLGIGSIAAEYHLSSLLSSPFS
mmetsp:Transcript_27820/g.47290  ORF Transcript_27820/g.47290 Transcript_27820/m.47290 type:complete len:563 (+) Transcript_27820:224-1912(+)|eukprot:CAMPEP_0183727376 /NCGR_PEP_ID=MMETSP0737-20130205/25577_1 /TAXON_ID=385413 /ORGANISM="Thalassiosira miniscula, Strain CCMP1093" /LENGTH=562 /DNA_ID=CAMNT_0025959003 /DNA_START=137 /DNA_END=1825 /DNA_ORIENTATION=-